MFPLADPNSEISLCKTAVTDITERKCMEQRLARLNHFKEQLLGPHTLSEKLKLITDVVVEVFDADFARIWVIEEGDLCELCCRHAMVAEGPDACRNRARCLHLVASSGRYVRLDGSHCRVPLGCYKIGRVATGEEPKLVTNDVAHDPRVHDHGWAASLGLVAFAGYRLLSPEGTPLGVLAAFSKRPISTLEEALLEDLAHTASQVIRAGMAEKKLQEEKAFADIVIESIPGLFYVLDSQGRFVRWNRAEEELTGLTAEQLRGREGLLTIVEDDRDLVAGKIREVFEQGQAEVEARVIAKDGIRHFLFTGRRMDVGRSSYLVGSGVDLTERKTAEESLRVTQFSVDRAGDAVFWLRPDARFVYANRRACDHLGYSREELLAMTVHDIDPEYPADVWRQHWEELRRRGSYTFESRHRTKGGRLVPVEITVNYLEYEGHEFNCAFVRDITGRKQAEAEVRQAQQRVLELQRREKELVEAELSKARDILVRQTRLAAVGQLSASIAHELRNPLGAIRNAVFLIGQTICPKESQCQQYLDIIRNEAVAASGIITDCMAMSRGKPPTKSPVALGTIVVKARSQVDAPEAIQWQWIFTPDPFVVHADAAQLEQVFRNLFVNAIQALGEAGSITVEAIHAEKYDEILVADSGPGIPVELRDQVFEPLVTTRTCGTGLGLTICRQIIEQHGGAIKLSTRDKPGTTFQICLPAAGG